MTGIAHLSTALALKGRFGKAPLAWLLLAAAAPDLLWACLNLFHAAGEEPLELARVRQPFQTLGDLRLLEQPFSHSLLGTVLLGVLLGGLAALGARRSGTSPKLVGVPVFLAVAGHWFLDFLVHDADLPLAPHSASLRLGPAFALDPTAPGAGLTSTHPLASWGLQSGVVLVCAVTFLASYPSDSRRRWIFVLALLGLDVLAAPLFIRGMAAPLFAATVPAVFGTLGEIAALTCILYFGITRLTHPELRARYALESEELARFLRGLKLCGAALAFALSTTYLLQAGLDARRDSEIGVYSTALTVVYFGLGWGMAGASLSAWWPALFTPLLVGPLARVYFGSGSLGLLNMALELLLAVTALYCIRTLRMTRLLL